MSGKINENNRKAIDFLFQKPLEPVFTLRDNGKGSFDLPPEYYTERYQTEADTLQSRFGENVETRIPLRKIKEPNIEFASKIKRTQQFSLFNDEHKQIAAKLIEMLVDKNLSTEDFISLAAYIRDRLNPMLFEYVLSASVQHRDDTKAISIKPIAKQFPSNFVEPSVLKDARQEVSIISNPGNRIHVEIARNFTASDRSEEQRLAYFREDIGVNMHHWHWHLVYPGEGPLEIVNKDRRGELFYYMHHQIVARYNTERFCNSLPKVRVLNNLRKPISEGYFPKILSSLNNRTYPSRPDNTELKDIDRGTNTVELADVERWINRVIEAIDQGFVRNDLGETIRLDDQTGIDILGNAIEATMLSPSRNIYGNLHNMGHNVIALSHDPENRHLEDYGVMGDVSTAMRDPVFYRWHGYIDSIFYKFKQKLEPYSDQELGFNDVKISSFNVKLSKGQNVQSNVLATFWQKSDVDLAAGLDFSQTENAKIFAHFTHLQHAPFTYNINVECLSSTPKKGTCRIFLIPKSDERGTALKLDEQNVLAIEMDKFTVNLNPGMNTIRRLSTESSITIPYERSFRRIGKEFTPDDPEELASFQFCGCGWPHHLLLPKGTKSGMAFDLFVMVSDYAMDAVNQVNSDGSSVCSDAASFCGLKDQKYPDKRAMGYPFDRRSRTPTATLKEFVDAFSNMSLQNVTVIHRDLVVAKPPE